MERKEFWVRQIAAQVFEAGDFLNIFLRFLDFQDSFSYKNSSYKKTCNNFLSETEFN